MKQISKEVVSKGLSYTGYRQLTDGLLAQGKTTGGNHSEAMIHYTQLNNARMKRLDKTVHLLEETAHQLKKIRRPMAWLILTEAWCGDAAQIIPVLQKMAEANGNIDLRFILRDEHPDIMDAFLTNGGRSIPIVIILDAVSLDVLGSWGPRPVEVQDMVMAARKELNAISDEAAKKLRYNELTIATQKWYAQDKTVSIQREFLATLMESLAVGAAQAGL
ncbi:MAG: thioredoxin family protein [Lewinellaceae bacterium]|nr:thioredoxin family protein [Lewinellaceae bacterium]